MPTHPKASLVLLASFWPSFVYAQVGTLEQDITSIPAYSQQKNCATSCFQYSGAFCFDDFLGGAIGCAQTGNCESKGWLARNDCYCSPGLIKTATQYLSGCVAEKCSVGDVSVDIAMATSLYVNYCSEKGYVEAAPANAPAATTAVSGSFASSVRTTQRTPAPTTTGSGTDTNSTTDTPSSSKSLSTGSIIGIVVGSLAALAFLALAMWLFWKLFRSCFGQKPNYQQGMHMPPPAKYPDLSDQNLWHQSQGPGTELGPGDSVSMVGGMARPAPTLVSDMRYAGRY